MISSFNNNDVCAEIWSQQQAESFDHVWLLGFATRQTQLCELLVRTQHYQFWAKDNSDGTLVKVLLIYHNSHRKGHFMLHLIVSKTTCLCCCQTAQEDSMLVEGLCSIEG